MKTLAEIEQSEVTMLRASDIAPIFPADPHSIRLQARTNPAALGFPVICIGSSVFIPKEGFLRFCRALNIGEEAAEC